MDRCAYTSRNRDVKTDHFAGHINSLSTHYGQVYILLKSSSMDQNCNFTVVPLVYDGRAGGRAE